MRSVESTACTANATDIVALLFSSARVRRFDLMMELTSTVGGEISKRGQGH